MDKYYHHDLAGVYVGASDADPDPRNEGAFMPPPFCAVLEAPPPTGLNETARRVDDAWVVIPDFRGREYWLPDRTRRIIVEAGVDLPADALDADPGPTSADMWRDHQAQAQVQLDASDRVALRCFKAGVAFPPGWLNYVTALREIVRAETGDHTQALPSRPDYPPGT